MRSLSLPTRSSTLVALAAVAAVAVAAVGCFQPDVPPDAQIACIADVDCPPAMFCAKAIERCVDDAQRDAPAPAFDGEPLLAPAILGVGQTATLDFTVDQPLVRDPVVRVGAFQAPRDQADQADEENAYRFTYRATGQEPEGPSAVEVDVVGRFGSVATLAAGAIDFDFTAPVESSRQNVAPSFAGAGAELTASVTFDEDVSAQPGAAAVSAEGDALAFEALAGATANAVSFRYVVDAADREGTYTLRATLVDGAGNTVDVELGDVAIDNSAPIIAPTAAIDPLDRPLRHAEVLTVTIEASEVLTTAPTLTALPAGASVAAGVAPIVFAPGRIVGTFISYNHTVGANEDGTYALVVSAVVDGAGNVGADVTLDEVVFDGDGPSVLDFTQSAVAVTGADTIVATFRASEALGAAPVVALIDSVNPPALLSLTSLTPGADPFEASLALAGSGVDGTKQFEITLVDVAGNVSVTRLGSLTVDARAPGVLAAFFSPEEARANVPIVLSVTVDEPLGAEVPAVRVVGPRPSTAAVAFALLEQSGLALLYELPVGQALASGTYDLVEVSNLVDLAGNAAPPLDVTAHAATFVVDNEAPAITLLAVDAARYSATAPFDVVTVTFTLSEAPASVDAIVAGVALADTDCVQDGPALTFTCVYQVRGDEGDGAASVVVTARDGAGNVGVADTVALFDFTPPRVVAGSARLVLSPPPGSPAAAVTQLAVGGTATVSFALDEDEAPAFAPLVRSTSPAVLTFGAAVGAGSSFAASLTLLATPAPVNGAYTLQAEVEDVVGNRGQAAIALATPLVVDTVAPAAPDVGRDALGQPRIVYTRAPWGTTTTSASTAMTLQGSAGAVQPAALVVVESAAAAPRAELGRTTANASTGAFGPLALVPSDRPTIFVRAVDAAGNASAAVAVRDTVWIATLGQKIPGSFFENPHRFEARGLFTSALVVGGSIVERGGDLLALNDGAAATVAGAAGRFDEASSFASVGTIAEMTLATDALHGQLVGFGGRFTFGGVSTFRPGTLGWNGSGFRALPSADLEGDGEPPSSFGWVSAPDPRRGRIVLYVGASGSTPPNDEVWEWDGTTWKRVTPGADAVTGEPNVTFRAAIAPFPEDVGVVVFGGFAGGALSDKTWRWSGTSWSDVTPATARPSARASVMATRVSSVAGDRTILFGGQTSTTGTPTVAGDTWQWDGTTWSPVALTGPPARRHHRIAYDPSRDVFVLFGGLSSTNALLADIWELPGSGNAWTQRCTGGDACGTGPSPRFDVSMAYDPVSAQVIIAGGALDATAGSVVRSDEVWGFDGGAFTLLAPGNPSAPPQVATPVVSSVAGTFDRQREVFVHFGGVNGSNTPQQLTAYFTGAVGRFFGSTLTGPAARSEHTMTYDVTRARSLLFGGLGAGSVHLGDTWLLDASGGGGAGAWTAVCNPTCPVSARRRVALAADERTSPNVNVLYGGRDATTTFADTWVLSAGASPTWTQLCGAPLAACGPGAQDGAVMVYDGARNQLLLITPTTPLQVWTLGSTTWTQAAISDPEGDGNPPPRTRFAAAFDGDDVILFGGNAVAGGGALDDAWAWNGTSWRALTPADPEGDGNPEARDRMVMSHDPRFGGRALLVGGVKGNGFLAADAWRWQNARASAPAGVFTFDVDAAAIDATTTIEGADIEVTAGGRGKSGAADIDGVELFVWFPEGWRSMASNAAAPGAPARIALALSASELALALIDGRVAVAVAPRGPNGADTARVVVDAGALTLRFRSP